MAYLKTSTRFVSTDGLFIITNTHLKEIIRIFGVVDDFGFGS